MSFSKHANLIMLPVVIVLLSMCSFLIVASVKDADKIVLELIKTPFIYVLIVLTIIGLIVTAFFCLTIVNNASLFDELENGIAELDKEKERYRQATNTFVENFNIKSEHLL